MPKDDEPQRIDIRSYDQKGGFTGILNIVGVEEATAEFSEPPEEEQLEDGYLLRRTMTIRARWVIPVVQVAAYSPTIRKMDVRSFGVFEIRGDSGMGFVKNKQGTVQIPCRWAIFKQVSGVWLVETVTEQREPVEYVVQGS